ncbi:MAG: T9SS type A sorting domain-containing protein [Calditrichaeota bacterium]|nr:T9SS type A sorting domain-containing protein [Calditrichota bacterium]
MEDCISIDPRFFDAEGLIDGTPDFRLRADSPCIGAGFEGTDMGANLFEGEEFNQEVPLNENWNGISLRVIPQNPNIIDIFAPIVERENLAFVKDDQGRFYAPEWGFSNIGDWIYSEGYLVNMIEQDVLEVEGILVPCDEPIDLKGGWNIISYYPEQDMWVGDAIEPILEQLFLVKNSDGEFWIPRIGWGFDFRAGEAFWVNVIEDTRFAYPILQEEGERVTSHVNLWSEWDNILTENGITATGSTMNMILKSDYIRESGQILAKSENGNIYGAGICADGYCAMILYGDDEFNTSIDGFSKGSRISLFYNEAGSESIPISPNPENKVLTYETNGFAEMDVTITPTIPEKYYMSQNYPNPFNSQTTLTFGLPENVEIYIGVYTLSGRLVETLIENFQTAGHHSINWTAGGRPSGVYMVKMQGEGFESTRRVVLVR